MNGTRIFAPSDAAACCDVINAAIEMMDGLNQAARDLVRAKTTADTLRDELSRYHTLVYESDGRILGLGGLDLGEIKRFYVLPSAQGHGVGRAVMDALEAEARAEGATEVRAAASPSAVPFYARMGYETVDDARFSHGEAEFHYVMMRKRLTRV